VPQLVAFRDTNPRHSVKAFSTDGRDHSDFTPVTFLKLGIRSRMNVKNVSKQISCSDLDQVSCEDFDWRPHSQTSVLNLTDWP